MNVNVKQNDLIGKTKYLKQITFFQTLISNQISFYCFTKYKAIFLMPELDKYFFKSNKYATERTN
jgi:hypothetical protein